MRWVSDPTSYPPLASFACGGTSEYEQDVEEALSELRDLSPEDPDKWGIRAAETPHDGELIAVSVFHQRHLGDSDVFAGAVCLELLTVGEHYRDWRMPDGATGIGTFLLCDALAQIEAAWGNPMPYVWAIAHRDNLRCRAVLRRHSFSRLKGSNGKPSQPYFVHLRNEDLAWTYGFSPRIIQAVEQASGN